MRWPITDQAGGPTTVGPAELLHRWGTQDRLAVTPDGTTIAAAMYGEGGLVLDVREPRRLRWLRPHRDVRYIATSPDGRWVVTGSQHETGGLKLWDARTGRLVQDLPGVPDQTGRVWSFSPDGRWLAVNRQGWLLFETSTWTPKMYLHRGLSRALDFAPDSRTVVFDNNAETLILAEVETGRELARVEDPEQARLNRACFTPDGSRLVATLLDRPYVRVWDLRAIRLELARLRLDWGPPATFDAPETQGSLPTLPEPYRILTGPWDHWLKQSTEPPDQVVDRTTRAIADRPGDDQAHHDRAHALVRLRRFDEAIADFTAALKARPDDVHLLIHRGYAADRLNRLEQALGDCGAALRHEPAPEDRGRLAVLCNNLAWTLASRPGGASDPSRALELARRALELDADEVTYLNTLGVAEYRAGRHAEAIATLEKSLAAGGGQFDAFDLYFLAMARCTLGQTARARADFDRAVKWRRDHPSGPQRGWNEELDAFEAEARDLLDRPPPELPADVFAPGPPGPP